MPDLSQKVSAYLEKLDAERRTALAISKEKAEEAKLIKARQEGFQDALELLGLQTTDPELRAQNREAPKRARRNIPDLILRELSFSGTSMSKSQIAKAIGYLPSHTERALKRLENTGKVMQTPDGRWEIVGPVAVQPNGHAVIASK
jgi:DNA-binding transcriptional ArsR family regulator